MTGGAAWIVCHALCGLHSNCSSFQKSHSNRAKQMNFITKRSDSFDITSFAITAVFRSNFGFALWKTTVSLFYMVMDYPVTRVIRLSTFLTYCDLHVYTHVEQQAEQKMERRREWRNVFWFEMSPLPVRKGRKHVSMCRAKAVPPPRILSNGTTANSSWIAVPFAVLFAMFDSVVCSSVFFQCLVIATIITVFRGSVIMRATVTGLAKWALG